MCPLLTLGYDLFSRLKQVHSSDVAQWSDYNRIDNDSLINFYTILSLFQNVSLIYDVAHYKCNSLVRDCSNKFIIFQYLVTGGRVL